MKSKSDTGKDITGGCLCRAFSDTINAELRALR